jgi:hypothetical protein
MSAGSHVHCLRNSDCRYTLATLNALIRGFGGWQLNRAGLASIYRKPKAFRLNNNGLVD